MKLVDLTVLEAVAERRVGSSPTPGTKQKQEFQNKETICLLQLKTLKVR